MIKFIIGIIFALYLCWKYPIENEVGQYFNSAETFATDVMDAYKDVQDNKQDN